MAKFSLSWPFIKFFRMHEYVFSYMDGMQKHVHIAMPTTNAIFRIYFEKYLWQLAT